MLIVGTSIVSELHFELALECMVDDWVSEHCIELAQEIFGRQKSDDKLISGVFKTLLRCVSDETASQAWHEPIAEDIFDSLVDGLCPPLAERAYNWMCSASKDLVGQIGDQILENLAIQEIQQISSEEVQQADISKSILENMLDFETENTISE